MDYHVLCSFIFLVSHAGTDGVDRLIHIWFLSYCVAAGNRHVKKASLSFCSVFNVSTVDTQCYMSLRHTTQQCCARHSGTAIGPRTTLSQCRWPYSHDSCPNWQAAPPTPLTCFAHPPDPHTLWQPPDGLACLWVCFCVGSLVGFLDSTQRWNHMMFVFLWLLSHGVTPSPFVPIVMSGKVSFSSAAVYTCMYVDTRAVRPSAVLCPSSATLACTEAASTSWLWWRAQQ